VTYEKLAATGRPRHWPRRCALYRGDFLDGFVIEEAPFEEWLQPSVSN